MFPVLGSLFMNLRRRAAETLEDVTNASTTVSEAAKLQTFVVGIIGIGVIVAISLGIKALIAAGSITYDRP